MTCLVLGLPSLALVSLVGAGMLDSLAVADVFRRIARPLLRTLAVAMVVKLAVESSVFIHLRDKKYTLLKRSAVLLNGDLGPLALGRLAWASWAE